MFRTSASPHACFLVLQIPTRTVVQIRTHAQKYFQKLQKDSGYDGPGSEFLMSPTGTGRSPGDLSSPPLPFSLRNRVQQQQQLHNALNGNMDQDDVRMKSGGSKRPRSSDDDGGSPDAAYGSRSLFHSSAPYVL